MLNHFTENNLRRHHTRHNHAPTTRYTPDKHRIPTVSQPDPHRRYQLDTSGAFRSEVTENDEDNRIFPWQHPFRRLKHPNHPNPLWCQPIETANTHNLLWFVASIGPQGSIAG